MSKPFLYVTDPNLIPHVYEEAMKQDAIGFDVETTRRRDLPVGLQFDESIFKPGLDPYLSEVRLVQIATTDTVYVIDCFHCGDAVRMLAPIFISEDVLKIGHNLKFDMKMTMRQYGFRFRRVYDTMLVSQILSNGIKAHKGKGNHGLGVVAERYLKIKMDKSQQTSNWGQWELSEEQLRYAAMDVAILHDLCRAQIKFLVDSIAGRDLRRVVTIENNCCIAFARMELDGAYVDVDLWNEVDAELAVKFHEVSAELKDQLGVPDINLNSPAQLLKALQAKGIDVPNTSNKTIAPLEKDYPLLALLMNYRGLAKLLSSYGNGIPGKKRKKGQVFFLERVHPITGRVHANFSQCWAETGRTSCSEPNIQQVPNLDKAGFRYAFSGHPFEEGKNSIIVADYSQIEMRILAELSGDPTLMRAFQMGGDLHTATAALMFNVDPKTIQYKDPKTGEKIKGDNAWMRSAAKSINFGLVYGRGPTSLAGQIGVSVQEAKRLIAKYFNTYPSIDIWLTRAANFAIRNGFCTTASGRIRYFEFDRANRVEQAAVAREGKNTPIQGTSADITKIALFRIHCATENYIGRVFMSNTVHDEIVLDAPDDLAHELASMIVKEMEEGAYELLSKVPVISECGVGADWTVK